MKTAIMPLSLMISLALPGITHAAHQPQDAAQLDKVTVSAPAVSVLPQDTAHLHQHDMASHRARTSDTTSMLKGIAGVSIYTGGGAAGLPVIRGLADDRLRIKVDGMDLISACANHMNAPLSYISPSRVSELKVYSGISPVSVGGDSIGGTIIANSATPEFASNDEKLMTKGELGAYYRSNGDARGASISTTVASDKVSLTYTGSTSKANNYDAGGSFKPAGAAASDRGWLDADEVGSSAYETRNHAVDLGVKLDNHLFQLKFAHQDIPYQGWPNQRMDMTENRSNSLNLLYTGNFDWGSLETSIYREKTHHKMQFGDDKQYLYGNAPGMPMETEGDNRGVSIKTELLANDRDTYRLGVDLQRYRLDDFWEASGTGMMMAPNTFWNINNGQRDRYGLFAEWEANWTEKWTTLAGIRHETVKMDTDNVQGYSMMYQNDADAFNNRHRDHTDSNLDLTLMARYTPSETQTYEFGYAQKTRSPNLYERYSWSRNSMAMIMVNLAGDGNGYVGNIDLDPEIAHTVSFTADWHDAKQQDWRVSITPYLSYVDGFIDAERCSGAMGGMMGVACSNANLTTSNDFVFLQYQNVSARLFGVDLSASKQLMQSDQYGNFAGSAVISYVKGENRDSGDDLYNIMPLNALFAIDHAKGQWHNRVEWELVAGKDRVNQARNETKTAGYGLMHLRSSYEWEQVRLDVGVENLFDKLYSYPLSGAYTGQGSTMGTIPWGMTVPGMGRSVYAGVTYQF